MEEKKSLIAITSCNRLSEVKKYIWDYLRFVNSVNEFDFVLALDGNCQEYKTFANEYAIPLIYSMEREGVGLSKNRVVKQFPNYDYYFFFDDDVELLNSSIFSESIKVLVATGYHHLCGNHISSLIKTENVLGKTITHSSTGGGYFTCYSKKSLEVVGGWNTIFAKYKRFGHSEHTYRLMHSGLQPSPFIFVESFRKKLLIHSPPSVSENFRDTTMINEWVKEERELINEKSSYFPLRTLSPYYFNQKNISFNQKVADFLISNPQKYPLTNGKERRTALSEYFALKIPKTNGLFPKIRLLLKSFWFSPTNVALKHYIKTKLFGR